MNFQSNSKKFPGNIEENLSKLVVVLKNIWEIWWRFHENLQQISEKF